MADQDKPILKAVPSGPKPESAQADSTKPVPAAEPVAKDSGGTNRPAVVPLSYPDKKALHKAYMPFMKNGGLFLPTAQHYEMGDEIFLLVSLPDNNKAIPVPGSVVWRTPAVCDRRPGSRVSV